ncbi:MAG: Ig-like domain-containing protein [Candidatus Hydrogenedentales bacterium]
MNQTQKNGSPLTGLRSVVVYTLALGLLFLGMSGLAYGQGSVVFDTAGADSFTVPDSVTSITVEVWGAGGSGGSRAPGGGNNTALAGGGGGGYSRSTFSVTPGTDFDVYVGKGSSSTAPGEDSWFGSPIVVSAQGGQSVDANSNVPGAGGSAAAGIGDVKYDGGTGAAGVGGSFGGGGGSAAGTGAAGAYGDSSQILQNGATAPSGGGDGGDGAQLGTPGAMGVAPGGGGGGGFRAGSNSTQAGGNGADGKIVISCSCDIDDVIFAAGTSSVRCSGAGQVFYTATATGADAIEYALDADSLTAGNSINAATGEVTYVGAWSGTTEITATASSSKCMKSAVHTVTVTPTVSAPVFNLGASSQRCRGTETIVYGATAEDSTGMSYSLDAASLAAGNTIDEDTGEVVYVATWSGTSVITASAEGCNGPVTSEHHAMTDTIFANNDTVTAMQGVPVSFNVLDNDLCDIDPNSITITHNPVGGFVQVGAGGEMTYVSFGAYLGEDSISYQVCSPAPVVCVDATVNITVTEALDNPCYLANKNHTFYLPFPENDTQLRQSLLSAGSNNDDMSSGVRTILAVSVPYPKTAIVYDHWEDGYEADINAPLQPTTEIWGDGDLTNGVAPGYPDDLIPPGGYIIIDETFAWTRTGLQYDGKDKIFSTSYIAVSKVSGAASRFAVQNVKTNVSDISRFGQFFILPFGEDVTAGPTTVFRYTGLFVRAAEDGTIVELDYDGDGVTDVSQSLNEGEVWFYNGQASSPGNMSNDTNKAIDIKAGARVLSNKAVGVDLVFGGIDNYGTRNIPVLPGKFNGASYVSPVYSTDSSAPAVAYFVNPNADPITIHWKRHSGSPLTGSFTVPADNGITFFNMDVATGTEFISSAGESFTAVTIIDADTNGSAFDWAFNMIPEHRLTPMAAVAWAPGSSNLSANYAPVWVSASQATTVYVKYDGNITAGDPNQISPCGAHYDNFYVVDALESLLIYNSTNDNSGMIVYNCDNIPLAAVWGQRPFGGTPTTVPAQDVGYTMEPVCLSQLVFATDDWRITERNTPITIDIVENDGVYLCTLDPSSVVLLSEPLNGSLEVHGDGTVTYTPNTGFVGVDSFDYRIRSLTTILRQFL